jgi:hypothetical protein
MARLQDAAIGANFWALDPFEMPGGPDGVRWTIEGRRKEIYRAVRRWCSGGAVWSLGRLIFDLAGLDDIIL